MVDTDWSWSPDELRLWKGSSWTANHMVLPTRLTCNDKRMSWSLGKGMSLTTWSCDCKFHGINRSNLDSAPASTATGRFSRYWNGLKFLDKINMEPERKPLENDFPLQHGQYVWDRSEWPKRDAPFQSKFTWADDGKTGVLCHIPTDGWFSMVALSSTISFHDFPA